MKILNVGRNDPCPCGSGKKYKKCCLGKDEEVTPGLGAAEASESLRQALDDRQFNSLEEVQALVEQHTQQQNQRALVEFHGLSPEQMHRLLNFPFVSPQLIRFPETLDTGPKAPILTLFELLVGAIGEQGLKPTAKGNLPQKFCRESALVYWGEQKYRENTRFRGINREDDFLDLHVTRLVAELAGLIRKYKGRFILSRDCRALLAGGGLASIYPRLFRTYAEQFNWGYRDRYPEIRFIQQAFLFTLYLLTRHGDTWLPHEFYEDSFLRAFPSVLNEMPPSPVFSPEEEIRRCYTWRTLVDFAGLLGLAEVEPITKERLCHQYRLKALPLLNEAVQFQLFV
ncbi:MAG: SEC-C metal-binding domain-containing protein [Pseudomonadota bacterium]